jgi:hypothetical protein
MSIPSDKPGKRGRGSLALSGSCDLSQFQRNAFMSDEARTASEEIDMHPRSHRNSLDSDESTDMVPESSLALGIGPANSISDDLVKVVILGDEGTGKSLLFRRLVDRDSSKHQSFRGEQGLTQPTVGCDFASFTSTVPGGAGLGYRTLQLWDCSGAPRFRSGTRHLYRIAGSLITISQSHKDI